MADHKVSCIMPTFLIVYLLPLAVSTKVKFARKSHTENMEVDGDERRQSSNMEALNAQTNQESSFAFRMAQELTFLMLAHTLQSMCDGLSSYIAILLTCPSNRPLETGGSCVSRMCHPVDRLVLLQLAWSEQPLTGHSETGQTYLLA
jgi:hypothetical protein